MNAEQTRIAEQVQADAGGQETEPKTQPARTSKGRWGSAAWILGCLGGGGLLIAAALAWGYGELGSFANTLAYLNGERLLVDPGVLSFGTARRGEERDLHVTIRNRTGKTVTILGAKQMRLHENGGGIPVLDRERKPAGTDHPCLAHRQGIRVRERDRFFHRRQGDTRHRRCGSGGDHRLSGLRREEEWFL